MSRNSPFLQATFPLRSFVGNYLRHCYRTVLISVGCSLISAPLKAEVVVTGDVTPAGFTSPIWNTGGQLRVGEFGVGSMTINPGGSVTNTTSNIGFESGSSGSVFINGGNWNNSAILVGRFGSGNLDITAGTVSTNSFSVGFYEGSVGTVNMFGGSLITNTGTSVIGREGTGNFTLHSGDVQVLGQTSIGGMAGSTGTLTMNGGTWSSGIRVDVGLSGNGTLIINNGATLQTVAGNIAANAGSSGTATINGGTWVNSSLLRVGWNAHGVLNLNGGVVAAGNVIGDTANSGNSSGQINFNGGTLRLMQDLNASFPLFSSASPFSVNLLGGGGTIDTQQFSVVINRSLLGVGALTVTGEGVLSLRTSSSYSGGTLVTGGVLLAQNASGSATGSGTVVVADGGAIGGNGRVSGNLVIQEGGQLVFSPGQRITLGGTLELDPSFGVANLVSLTGSSINWATIANGSYPLLSGPLLGSFDADRISNFGLANAFNIGNGRSAYFADGNLVLVVIPEPGTTALLFGLACIVGVVFSQRRKAH